MMNFGLILERDLVIQIHLYAAVAALVIGALVLWRRKGGVTHKLWGRVWVGLMVVVSFSSFFIHEIRTFGLFSPIHLLSVITPISLFLAVRAIRTGQVSKHKTIMKSVFAGGLVVAGLFTFMPGRLLHNVFLEGAGFERVGANYAIMVALGGAAVVAALSYASAKFGSTSNSNK